MQDFYKLYHGNMESSKEPQRWVSLSRLLSEDNNRGVIAGKEGKGLNDAFLRRCDFFQKCIDNLGSDGYDGWLNPEDRYDNETSVMQEMLENFRTRLRDLLNTSGTQEVLEKFRIQLKDSLNKTNKILSAQRRELEKTKAEWEKLAREAKTSIDTLPSESSEDKRRMIELMQARNEIYSRS